MEEFVDVQIVKERRKAEQAAYHSIETGIYVKDRLVEFEQVELFEKKLTIMLPKGFKALPDDVAKRKYSSEKRPQVILGNGQGDVNFTFSHFPLNLEPRETIQAAEQFKNMIRKVHPANIFYEMKEETIGEAGKETRLSWFDFKGYAVDAQTYTMMYVTPLEKTILHGVFSCLFTDAPEWKPAALLAITSLVDRTLKREEETR